MMSPLTIVHDLHEDVPRVIGPCDLLSTCRRWSLRCYTSETSVRPVYAVLASVTRSSAKKDKEEEGGSVTRLTTSINRDLRRHIACLRSRLSCRRAEKTCARSSTIVFDLLSYTRSMER